MKNHRISRRHFLTGASGVTVGLPFLEALTPGRALAAGAAPKRFMLFFQCAGVKRENFYPSAMGALTAESFAGKSTAPLAPYADKVTIPRGIRNAPSGSDGHAQRPITSSTCSASNGRATGISIDQEIAKHVNPMGRKALATHVGAFEKSQRGYISWFPGSAAETFANPFSVYKQLVGLKPPAPADPAEAARAAERLTKRRESVLDLVKDRMEQLRRMPLAKSDRERLDMHFTSLRGIETKMMATPGLMPAGPSYALSADREAEVKRFERSGEPTGNGQIPPVSYLHLELTALAWAMDYTRSASIMYGTVGTGSTWNFEGVACTHMQHSVSHREGPDPETKLTQIDNWHAKHLRFFLDKLNAYKEPGGSVLDNSAVVWTNEIDHGVGHNIDNMPYVIVGGLGGYLKTGQHFRVQSGVRNAHLWVTMLQGFGINANSFGVGGGEGSGRIAELVR
jgi:hypothetical protein